MQNATLRMTRISQRALEAGLGARALHRRDEGFGEAVALRLHLAHTLLPVGVGLRVARVRPQPRATGLRPRRFLDVQL